MGLCTSSDVCIHCIMPVCPVPAGVAALCTIFHSMIKNSIVYPCYLYTLYAETLSQWGGREVVGRGRGQWFCLFIYWLTTTDWSSQLLQSERTQVVVRCCFRLLVDCFSMAGDTLAAGSTCSGTMYKMQCNCVTEMWILVKFVNEHDLWIVTVLYWIIYGIHLCACI